ncbi:MAG: type II secretion system F family protein [Gammaproteobacteria bacterium]|nr:type II secretion system F family protein [Gammaproteobacteria bacterium]MBU1654158.1 type II secretion system F family protein [Gammaproteobacteria bacterium]MBU1960798.1 type II secretion system F family protein [Gammaproteobacteria bacterium]
MPLYQYKGRNRQGEAMRGRLEAENEDQVAEQLFNSGITPIEIHRQAEEREKRERLLPLVHLRGVSLDELIMLARQLHTLLRAGVPILKGFSSLIQTTRNPLLKEALQQVMNDLQGGVDLGSALARHPRLFSPLFISIVRVGENTGRLDEAFLQLAAYLEMEKTTRDQVVQALRYPMIVLAVIAVAVVILNIKVIPQFASAFAKFHAELPLYTRLLMAVSAFFVNWWRELAAAAVGTFLGIRFWIRTEQGDYLWSKWKLRLPLVGGIVQRAVLGRFCRSLAISIRAGVPLVQSLTTIANVVDNGFVAARILNMRDGIERGESVFRTATATGLFTPLVLQMIAIGEETGALDDLLLETADHYEREVSYDLKRLSDTIEPVIIITLGFLVLMLALGIFLPMWELSSAAGR